MNAFVGVSVRCFCLQMYALDCDGCSREVYFLRYTVVDLQCLIDCSVSYVLNIWSVLLFYDAVNATVAVLR